MPKSDALMRAPEFWRGPPGFAAHALSPLAWVYGAITARRMRRKGQRVGVPVICVGNFTAGGAGKTPTVIALVKILRDMGANTFVVSRGYGGSSAGPLRVDPSHHDAAIVGDEPLEIAAHAPVIVSRDRIAGARMAVGDGASVVLLDDGLQNPALHKDFSFSVIDGETWFGNGYCLPAGPLRAPVAEQIGHVGAVIVIGGEDAAARSDGLRDKPLLRARMAPDPAVIASLRERPALAFAGIGRPAKFFDMLIANGVAIGATEAFADHQPYSDSALATLASRGEASGWSPVTTMKDFARIGVARAEKIFGGRLRVVPVELMFDEAKAVRALLESALRI